MGITTASRSRMVVTVVAVLVLVVGLVGFGVAITSRDDESTPAVPDPSPVLTLSRTSSEGLAASTRGGAAGPYELHGALPTATEDGVVIDPGASTATETKVRALTAALGMQDVTITQVRGEGWTAAGTAAGQRAAFALDQRAGNVWQYARGPLADCLSIRPGAEPNDAVSCAAQDGGATSGGATRGPGRTALLREAKDVFALVGITPGTGLVAREDRMGETSLAVPITVEGLPVVDVTMSVSADAHGITSASGWLDPTFTTVGRYPLVSASAAFTDLKSAPQPAIGTVCPSPQSATNATCDTPRKVTAARLAWLISRQGEQPLLVPAWQFQVDGFYGPAVVAVAPQFLAGSTPAPE